MAFLGLGFRVFKLEQYPFSVWVHPSGAKCNSQLASTSILLGSFGLGPGLYDGGRRFFGNS